jgi:hypothetical protein
MNMPEPLYVALVVLAAIVSAGLCIVLVYCVKMLLAYRTGRRGTTCCS